VEVGGKLEGKEDLEAKGTDEEFLGIHRGEFGVG
jgi:hypothetical protein